ncbi:GNAT family N-acetyltransferase [Chromobacterium amazonense]|uniref:GNAT family N-acetyltransferase n=1 Tax=Chromobacterium amazonense TaxID=1382803 RepID=UPI003B967E6E
MLSLRPAQSDDIPLIAALHAQSWRASYRGILPDAYLDERAEDDRLAVWRARFASEKPLWVRIACWEDEPVGFVCLLPDEAPELGIYLDNLHVRGDQQGRGIGRRRWVAPRRCRRRSPAASESPRWMARRTSSGLCACPGPSSPRPANRRI